MSEAFTAAKFLGQVTLNGATWSMEFSSSELPAWVEFYQRMVDRYGHKTDGYQSALDALRGLK